MHWDEAADGDAWTVGGEPGWRPASFLVRIGGSALDATFRHIILIPVTVPVTDWSFRSLSVLPALGFVAGYFGFLAALLRYGGLTPGGWILGYRVVDLKGQRLRWGAAWRRLAPYIAGHLLWVWLLAKVIHAMRSSGEVYSIDLTPRLIAAHGGGLFWICQAAQLFLIVDLAFIPRTQHRRTCTDLLAGSVALSRPA